MTDYQWCFENPAAAAVLINELEQRLADAEALIKDLESKPKYGCHCDLEPGQTPDACVLDTNEAHLCVYAERLMREWKVKTACEYWQIIKVE